ncbi:MAG: hypothetical protein QFF03_25065 [Pseudomonadota bacterium]|nr:hypothetical protein [Pseudomonadota bacterium]
MNIRKNAEAVFLAAAVVATFATYAMAAEPVHFSAPAAVSSTASNSAMQVVVIKGHRLSAAEKAALN